MFIFVIFRAFSFFVMFMFRDFVFSSYFSCLVVFVCFAIFLVSFSLSSFSCLSFLFGDFVVHFFAKFVFVMFMFF